MADVRAGKLVILSKLVTESDISLQADGTTVEFDIGENYHPGTMKLFLNGLRQQKGSGKDYEETLPDKVTFSTAPEAGDVIIVDYLKS